MKPVSLLFVIGLGAAVVAAGCGKKTPQTIAPVANADSAAAAEKARADSAAAAQAAADRRAREEAQRVRRQQEADSMAARGRTSEQPQGMGPAMTQFDYDTPTHGAHDPGTRAHKAGLR